MFASFAARILRAIARILGIVPDDVNVRQRRYVVRKARPLVRAQYVVVPYPSSKYNVRQGTAAADAVKQPKCVDGE